MSALPPTKMIVVPCTLLEQSHTKIMNNENNGGDKVFGFNGEFVGTVVREGGEWVAYGLNDIEQYRGPHYMAACDSLR